MDSRPIFIVGMPACGKSTFGRALARALQREFIDLDRYIENRFHTDIPTLFAERGEASFRALESAMLRETGEFSEVVVATGGGAPCHSANMEYMLSHGTTVWLKATLPRIVQRIMRNPHRRPLLAGLDGEALHDRLEQMRRARYPFYSRAGLCIDSDRLETRESIADTVGACIPLL